MRIGILTLPFNNNYGGYLQAYALMTVLKQMGHEVELINRRSNRISLSVQIRYFIKTLIKMVLGLEHGSLILDIEKEHNKRGKLIIPFVDKNIYPKTKSLFSTKDLTDECKDRYDAIIVGSDQVWRPDYVPNIENFFLDFMKHYSVKRISYAASFGVCHPKYSKGQIMQCGKLLSMFDDVSVREESGANVMKDFGWHTKKKLAVVLDPTMLLDKSYYETLIINNRSPEKYVFTYVLDESQEAQAIVNIAVSTLNCTEKCIIDTKKWKYPDYRMPSIEEWLWGICNAEFVVTDSFHGTAFSIIFNKPFLVYENKGRGADRFHTLLCHFGLENRIVSDIADVDRIIRQSINWNHVNDRLKEEKEKSVGFISRALR